MTIDALNIESNLSALKQVESQWTLPAIPDMVKLDLASQASLAPMDLAAFANGVAADLQSKVSAPTTIVTPEADPTGTNPQTAPRLYTPSSADKFQSAFAATASVRAPRRRSTSAVSIWKQRAIDMGYLDPATPIDESWSTEYNSVSYEMSRDDFSRRISGDKPGALSIENVGRLADEWLSPTGLLRAAVNMDLVWDPSAIGKEASGWGDKWRSFIDKPSVGGLVDAVTGPIDDIVVPGINLLLLFNGVTSVYGFARAGILLRSGVAAADTVEAFHGGRALVAGLRGMGAPGRALGGVLEKGFVSGADDVARMSQPSWMSQKIGATSYGKGQAALMNKWRANPATVATKGTIQAGMRLGLAGRVEETLLPDQSGYGLNNVETIDDYVTRLSTNPLVWGLGEAMFTPYSVLQPGSFTSGLKAVGKGVKRTSMAAGDALETVSFGKLSTSFAEVGKNEKLTHEFFKAAEADVLVRFGEKRTAEFVAEAKKNGARKAMADLYTGGNEEALDVQMTFVSISAAIDAWALDMMGSYAKVSPTEIRAGTKGRQQFHALRNKAIAQLREYDPDDLESAVTQIRFFDGVKRKQAVGLRKAVQAGDEDAIAEVANLVRGHNQMRDPFIRDLFDNYMTEDVLQSYMPAVGDTLGRWSDFSAASTELSELVAAGGLSGARWRKAYSKNNRQISVGLEKDEYLPGHSTKSSGIDDMIENEIGYSGWTNERAFNPLAEGLDPSMGKFTVASVDSPTKQEYLEVSSAARWLTNLREEFAGLARGGAESDIWKGLRTRAEALDKNLTEVDTAVINEWLVEISAATGVASNVDRERRMRRLITYAAKNGITEADIGVHLDAAIDKMNDLPEWGSRYKIDVTEHQDLASKAKELQRRKNFVAAEIDPESIPANLRDGLDRHGYRLVHGVEFLAPSDIIDMVQPFADISSAHMRSLTLGNFFGRQAPGHVRALNQRLRRNRVGVNLVNEFHNAGTGEVTRQGVPLINPGSGAVDDVVLDEVNDALRRIMNDIREEVGEELRISTTEAGAANRLATRLKNMHMPQDVTDLSASWHQKKLVARLGQEGYSVAAATAIWKSLKESRQMGFQNRGLLAIEDHIRARPQLTNAMRLLGKSQVGTGLTGKATSAVGRYAGAAIGGSIAVADEINDPNFDGGDFDLDLIFRGAVGAAAGAAGANAAMRGSRAGLGVVGGVAGALAAGSQTDGNPLAMAGGAVAGATGAQGLRRFMSAGLADTSKIGKIANAIDDSSKWQRYAYLGDNLAQLRDYMRFSLSPIFDLSRYTEAMTLSQINPKAGNLKINQSPRAFRKMMTKEYEAAGHTTDVARQMASDEWAKVTTEFRRGPFAEEIETLESTTRWYTQQGIMGFSPNDWMASTYAHLRRAGKSAEEANEAVRSIYTYGTTGRSAAELSANFVFFPFSFTKKTLGHMAEFMSEDLSRAVVLQDMLRTYEILDEEYDLSTMWREHLPILDRFRRLNLFAYGISPGEFGGPNRPLWDFFSDSPVGDATVNPILNLFLPQGVKLQGKGDGLNIQQLSRRLFPVMNDTGAMIQDLQSQGHVMFGGNFMTEEAEISAAYGELNELKTAIDTKIRDIGGTGFSMIYNNDPGLLQLRGIYEAERARIRRKYPSFNTHTADVIADRQVLETELNDRIAAATQKVALGAPVTPRENALLQMQKMEDRIELVYGEQGISLSSNPEDLPPELWQQVRNIGVTLARENTGFDLDWHKFYRRKYGPITMELHG